MNSKRSILLAITIVFVLFATGLAWFVWFRNNRDFKIPDEKKAGVALLAETLTGPGYFQAPEHPAEFLSGEGGPWIAPEDALKQVERVAKERHYDALQTEKLKKFIGKLTEPHPSRVMGGDRIQLVRLNLALDQLKE